MMAAEIVSKHMQYTSSSSELYRDSGDLLEFSYNVKAVQYVNIAL